MKWLDLDESEREDIRDRWRAWYVDGPFSKADQGASLEKAINDLVALGADRDELSEVQDVAAQAIFGGTNLVDNSLVGRLVDEIAIRIPELQPVISLTPIIVLPTLDYEAFAHRLHSGRRFVAVSQMILTSAALVAEVTVKALSSAGQLDASSVISASNEISIICWHLNSGNHELCGYLASRSKISPSSGQIMSIATSMTAFVLLHELAHILLDHKSSDDPAVIRAREFEADEQAAKWWVQFMSPRVHWDLPGLGLASMFRFFGLSDQLREYVSATYPSWEDRYDRVANQCIQAGVPTFPFEAINALFDLTYTRAVNTILFCLDKDGQPRAYNHAGGTYDAVTALAGGKGLMILLMIGPDKKVHEVNIGHDFEEVLKSIKASEA